MLDELFVKDEQKALSKIDSFDLCKDEHKIEFKKVKLQDINTDNYVEIGGNISSNALATGLPAAVVSGLNKNGLFTATVNPELLTLFTDGTCSTMIREGGKIVKHAGFQAVSATVFAPMVIMQVLSMITGQYYMNGITKQLKAIDEKINLLIKFHHVEKMAKIENAQRIINELINLEHPGIEHIMQLKNIEQEIGSIFTEYNKYLSDININKTTQTSKFSSGEEMKELLANIDKSEFDFYLQMSVTTNEILHLIKIVELALNIKMNKDGGGRGQQINELIKNIKKWNYADFDQFRILADDFYFSAIRKAHIIMENSAFHGDTVKKSIELLESKKDICGKNFENNYSVEIKKQLEQEMNSKYELLCNIDSSKTGENKIFIRKYNEDNL
ncbi:hypothetical protein FACS1894130_10050 [Spirochaetia bacterium]|nr:hypothetical protein FACS1894130_10050 [Spirochaetia bacterium]